VRFQRWIFHNLVIALLAAPLSAWLIEDFHVSLFPEKDGSMLVEERITVDFGREKKHGIYRDIPTSFKIQGIKHSRRFRVIDVKKDDLEVPYIVRKRKNRLWVRIGDSKRYVSGVNVYEITYRVERGIDFREKFDEIYWNVTGTEWEVPINRASCTVYYPEGPTPLRSFCYTGKYGERASNCLYQMQKERADFYAEDLGPLEGLTIAIDFEKGYFKKPGLLKVITWFFTDNYFFLLPLLTLIGLVWIWKRKGRDPALGSVQVRYEPPEGLTPGEAGTLLDERVDIRDITSTLIDLARRGYLRIIEEESKKLLFFSKKDYIFEKLKPVDRSLKNHEISLLLGLFEKGDVVSLSSLKNRFYKKLKGLRNSIYSSLVKGRYFPMSPQKVRTTYRFTGIVAIALGFVLMNLMSISSGNPWPGIMVIISGALIVIFGQFMPRKTRKGVKKLAEILGFKEFLERVEKDKIERMHKENPNLFYDFLPFAIAFGVADEWADAFSGLFLEPPGWYSSPVITTGNIDAHLFTASIGNSLKAISSGFTSSPRGSSGGGGGGFSGGGAGGGGGGAW